MFCRAEYMCIFPGTPFVPLQKIVEDHWKEYGRNYYCRYDYESVDSAKAAAFTEALTATTDFCPRIRMF